MWLDLLLSGEPPAAFGALRDRLLADGRPAAEVERDARAASELRALLEQRRQRAVELVALNDIARHLAALRRPDELVREVTEQARRLLGVDLAYIGLVSGDEFVMQVASGALTPQLRGLRIPRTAGIAGAVVSRGEPVWASDYASSRLFSHHPVADETAAVENIRALLGVPLTVRGETIGALFVCKREERVFTEHEVLLLSALASHAAVAIDTAKTVDRLDTANAVLERSLAWDRRLTQVVLRGGGVEDLLSEIALAAGGEVSYLPAGDVTPPDALTMPVMADRSELGTLVLRGSSDSLLLERAAPVLALAVLRERAVAEAGRVTRDALLMDLLARPESGAARMRAIGLDPRRQYCVLVTSAPVSVPGAVTATDGSRSVQVVPAADPAALVAGWTGDVTGGAAGPAVGAVELAACYREAAQTVSALLTLGRAGQASTVDQLGIYRVLLDHAGRESLVAQYRRVLGPLLDERVPLLDTVRAYLDHGGRIAATAQELGVHVNTLYQRLSTVDRLLGQDWRVQPRALEIQLLLRLAPA